MAITLGGTVSETRITTTTTNADITHTVDSGTTLLEVEVHIEAHKTVTSAPIWDSAGVNETMTLIHATTSSALDGDVRNYTYGLVNPTAKTATISIPIDSIDNVASFAFNYIGTVATSVAAATNFLSEDVNDAPTLTSVHASAGTAGNCLKYVGTFKGGDGDPATDDAGFTVLKNLRTGTSTSSDVAYYVSHDLEAAGATAITVTWDANDDNASQYIEIIAAAGGASTPQGIQGMGQGINPQRSTRLGGELEQ